MCVCSVHVCISEHVHVSKNEGSVLIPTAPDPKVSSFSSSMSPSELGCSPMCVCVGGGGGGGGGGGYLQLGWERCNIGIYV